MHARNKKITLVINVLLLPFIALLLVSVLINLTGIDLKVSGKFWDEQKNWYLSNHPLFVFLYKFGPLPIFFLAGGALLLILFKYIKKGYSFQRRACLLIILSLLLGPGLVVNAIFKENFGRPRPRNTVEFGGNEQFVPLLVYNGSGSGKSFPSGHASMGFLWLAFAPWAISLRKKKLFIVLICLGLIHGGLMGFGRIVQGGHFFGDVLWSAGMDYLIGCLLLYPLFGKELSVQSRR